MKAMLIRLANESDLEEILKLWVATCEATYHFLTIKHTAEEDRKYFFDVIVANNQLWVAANRQVIVGFLAIQKSYIDRLYIHPDFQRKGIGTLLLDKARSLSPHELTLCTHQKNAGARAFYESQGFKATKYGISPPPESEPDVEYHWVPADIRLTGRTEESC